MAAIRHITLPGGFVAAGVACGIKSTGREDVAIIAAEGRPVPAALLTTSNQVIGEPVRWCRQVLPAGRGLVRGIVVNSGCSNVCTGRRGRQDAEAMAALTARLLGAEPHEVLVASTGVIGHHLPMVKIRKGIRAAAASLGRDNDQAALRAMMTTDTREKSAVTTFTARGGTVTVAGIIKGAGMIAPHVATMIAVVTTDAAASPRTLQRAFTAAVDAGINAATVDSDQSTSDTALALASGASGVAVAPASAAERKFSAAIAEVCRDLAKAMVRDGEGATKLIEVRVSGAASDRDARAAARAVADSPLFKCAVHGADPNWGRILAAAGRSAARVRTERASVRIGGGAVFARGTPRRFDVAAVRRHLAGDTVIIGLDLGLGRGKYTAYACDLSREYITINADYHT